MIKGSLLERYHMATQKLCAVIQPGLDSTRKRHAVDDASGNPRVFRYDVEDREEVMEERRGIHHLVHGWHQQGHPADVCKSYYTVILLTRVCIQGLYLSHPFSVSGIGMGGIACWYRATSMVTKTLAIMFEELFPQVYEEYQRAFDAGVWIEEDTGPWLGRAIVYKLQGLVHTDAKDLSPTASFPCGFFTGGAMIVPQLGAKFV